MTSNPNPRRRWFQFRLRTLLVLMLVTCIGMGWIAMMRQQARRQRAAVIAIEQLGGSVSDWSKNFAPTFQGWPQSWPSRAYFVIYTRQPGQFVFENESRVHAWLRWLVGDDYFTHPYTAVVTNAAGMEYLDGLPELKTLELSGDQIVDSDLTHLKGLPRLELLYISGNTITDAGLNHVTELTQLRELYISSTKVSDSGLKNLQQLLPNCCISRISSSVDSAWDGGH